MTKKMPSYYLEKYIGYVLGSVAAILAYRYSNPNLVLGKSEIFDKSIDVGGISFGFLLTVLTLLIQTENSVIQKLKNSNRFADLIQFNKEVVLCSVALFSYSFFLLIYSGELLKMASCEPSKISASIYFFIVVLTANKVYIFLRVFYNLTPNGLTRKIQPQNRSDPQRSDPQTPAPKQV